MKYRYTTWVPSWVSVKVELISEEILTKKEVEEKIREMAEPVDYGLCHQCSGGFELDSTNLDWDNWDKSFEKEKVR